MARIVYGLSQSLDGYVDHMKLAPDPVVFRHFVEQVRHSAATVYGRRMYDIMRYWEHDQDDWNDDARAYAAVWRQHRSGSSLEHWTRWARMSPSS